jgi:hypothetical protein
MTMPEASGVAVLAGVFVDVAAGEVAVASPSSSSSPSQLHPAMAAKIASNARAI